MIIMSFSFVSAGVSNFAKVDVVSNCPNDLCPLFNKPDGVWLFNWISNGFAQEKVNAYFDKSTDLKTDEGTAKEDFSIDIENTVNYCTYDIKREYDRLDIYTFDLVEFSDVYKKSIFESPISTADQERYIKESLSSNCDVISSGSLSDYAGFSKNTWIIPFYQIEVGGYCWKYRDNIGNPGSLQNLKYDFETTFSLKSGSKSPITKTLSYSSSSNSEGISTNLGNNALVMWDGNLVSGETCPTGSDEYMLYRKSDSKWIIIDRLNYINYENQMNLNNLDSLAKTVYEGGYSEIYSENIINGYASKAIRERSLSYSPIISSYSTSAGRLKVNLNKLIIFPDFRLFVDSDYLELEIETGVPKLSKDFLGNCQPDNKVKFSIGDLSAGRFNVGLTNVGSADGSFEVYVTDCSDSNVVPGTRDIIPLKDGEYSLSDLTLVSNIGDVENLKGTCIVEAEETVTQVKDTCKISFDITKDKDCIDGRSTCSICEDNYCIKTCIDGKWEDTICNSDEVCDYNDDLNPVCIKGGGGDDIITYCEDCEAYAKSLVFGKIFKSQDCIDKIFQNEFFCIGAILRLFAVPLFFIISLLFGIQTISKLMKGKDKGLTWIISIILAFLVALLTYLTFYVGLVLIIIYLIVRVVINFIPGLNILTKMRK